MPGLSFLFDAAVGENRWFELVHGGGARSSDRLRSQMRASERAGRHYSARIRIVADHPSSDCALLTTPTASAWLLGGAKQNTNR